MSTPPDRRPRYAERLRVPARWWVFLALLLASLFLALAVSTPPLVTGLATAFLTTLGAGVLVGYGAVRVEVGDDELRAGRARLPWPCCGPASPLGDDATRRLRGVDADAQAFLLLRPYVNTAVRVDVRDPDDPTPYWLLSSRDPQRLAESINRARVLAD